MKRQIIGGAGLALLLAACGAENTETGDTARLAPVEKGSDATTNELFDETPDVAVVNGEQAATISISLPGNIDTLPEALAEELRDRANGGVEDFVATAEADRAAAETEGFTFRPHSLDVNWIEIGPREGRLAGFLGTYSTYTGGAHPNVGFDVLNWDREREAVISFSDLFEDPEAARVTIAEALKTGLLEAKRERLQGRDGSEEEMMEAWVEPAFEDEEAVYHGFTVARSSDESLSGGLIYHFAPYEVGAYAEGVYEVGVPYRAFEDQLKPAYADAFGGQPILP